MNLHGDRLPDIALYAPLCSGKSTVADYLVREYGYVRLAFANEVKLLAADMVNLVRKRAFGPHVYKDEVGLIDLDDINADKSVYRPLLQWLGTDLVRDHMDIPDFWVTQLIERSKTVTSPIVVDDMRFLNEAQMMHGIGAKLVRVTTDEDDRFQNYASFVDPAGVLDVEDIRTRWQMANAHSSESHYDAITAFAQRHDNYAEIENERNDLEATFANVEDAVLRLTYGERA